MHASLRNHLTIEVGELLQEPDILQQRRSALPGGLDVLVVDDGCAGVGGQLFFCSIAILLSRRSPRS